MNKKNKPTIKHPRRKVTPRARWARDWSQVAKVDSKRSTPMKVGGQRAISPRGQGKRQRKGGLKI